MYALACCAVITEVERNLQAARGGGEEIVVHVGNDRKLVALFELAEGRDRVREGQPVGERFGKRTYLGLSWIESQMLAEPADYGLQNFAVRMELSLLSRRFEFRVETQELRVGDGLAVGSENGTHGGEDSRLPVDEGAVAVKADEAVLSKVQHVHVTKANPGLVPWAAFFGATT